MLARTAKIIDGVAVAAEIRNGCRERIHALTARGVKPGLAVILVGSDPASAVYVRNKIRACAEVGIHSARYEFGTDVGSETILATIEQLNTDPTIHGILVQLPLPSHLATSTILRAISAEKDVDGFHLYNVGGLVVGDTVFPPCTPCGVVKLLEHEGISIEGKNVVVVGASNIVGKPMALMLMQRDATVSICHAKTRDLAQFTILADILVVAAGNLPLFEGLTLDVYGHLKDPLHQVLTEAKASTDRNAVLDGAGLSPSRRVEANFFFDRQFDRLFSALEKRVDPDVKGKRKTRRVREAVEAILQIGTHSQSHTDLLHLSNAINGRADRAKPLSCRLATTNFDLLFESAWASAFGADAISFDARMAPRSGAHNFEGIIHLHGMLSDNPKRLPDYILSSRDFARVYLRSGVIGNYIYDLMRRYTVMLVGYSADDPPMRYLMDAIGEDASLFEDMKPPFAIVDIENDLGSDSAEIETATWNAKEITPIFFKRRPDPHRFSPLWETLALWAAWNRDQMSWVNAQLELNMATPRKHASAFQRDFVQNLLSVLTRDERASALENLVSKDNPPPFDWIESIELATSDAGGSDGSRP